MLKRAYEKGREQWPGIELSEEDFARHLSTLLRATGGMQMLGEKNEQELSDLYLTCACALQAHGAAEALDRHYLAKLPQRLKHLRQPETVVEEVCQQMRIDLLVGTASSPPKIAGYTGRGTLLSWLQVIATRRVFKQVGAKQEEPEENVLRMLETLPAPERGVELELLKQRYQRELHQALFEAFSTLQREQRHLLRLRHVDSLTQMQIASLFKVTQPTILRRLERTYEEVFGETKRLLQERLGLSSLEFESMVKELRSQFDLSLSQVLREENRSNEGEGD